MPTGRAFQVKIVGDVKDAKRSLGSMEKKMGSFGKAMKGIAGAMIAAFAIQKVAAFVGSAVARAEEMNTLYAETAAIIDATGGAAGLAADEMRDMAKAFSMATGVDKAQVTEAQNILLTFKNIGRDSFEQTTSLVLDMAQVMKTDAKSAALQLGKAMNDPIAGVSALGRAGVQFTDEQKEQIRTLQESGDLMGAQAIVLAEMESQFGGVSEATANSTDKIKNMAAEWKEGVGNLILPLIDKFASWMEKTLLPALDKASKWFKDNVLPWYEEHIKPTMDLIMEYISEAWDLIVGWWEDNGEAIIAEVKVWADLIIGYYSALFSLMKQAAEVVWAAISYIWEHYGEQIVAVVQAWWDIIGPTIALIYETIKDMVSLVTAIFRGDWSKAWEIAQGMGERFLDYMKEIPGKVIGYMASIVGLIGPVAYDIGKAILTGIGNGLAAIGRGIYNAASSLGRAIANGFIRAWNRLDPSFKFPTISTPFGQFGGWDTGDLLPDIATLATGGIVTGPTLALVGEAGPEAVIPLSRGGGLGNTYNIIVQSVSGDPVAIGESIVEMIAEYERASGPVYAAAG